MEIKLYKKIVTSIIFGIAREESILEEDYISPVIDNLLYQFQFWNRLVLGHIVGKRNSFQGSQFISSIEDEVLTLKDYMGLETSVYQQVQKSTDLIPQDPYY